MEEHTLPTSSFPFTVPCIKMGCWICRGKVERQEAKNIGGSRGNTHMHLEHTSRATGSASRALWKIVHSLYSAPFLSAIGGGEFLFVCDGSLLIDAMLSVFQLCDRSSATEPSCNRTTKGGLSA